MPYDPALPANNSPGISAVMRSQLTGLQTNIQNAVADKVNQIQLGAAIAGTAMNPASVDPLSQTADGSYNQGQMQAVMDKLDEILNAIKRL